MKAEKHRSRVCSDLNNSPSPRRLATRPDSPRFLDAETGPAGLQTSPDQPRSGLGTPAITGHGHAAPACGHAPPPVPPLSNLQVNSQSSEPAVNGVPVSLQGSITVAHLCHVWRPPCLTTPPGSPDTPGSGLPVVLHATLGSTHWAPAWMAVLGALGGGRAGPLITRQ